MRDCPPIRHAIHALPHAEGRPQPLSWGANDGPLLFKYGEGGRGCQVTTIRVTTIRVSATVSLGRVTRRRRSLQITRLRDLSAGTNTTRRIALGQNNADGEQSFT